MNEQQLQQILTIQQAIAAAATAAVINSLLNPQQQQAASLAQSNASVLSDHQSNDLQQQQNLLLQLQQLQQDSQRRDCPTTTSPTATAECNNRIQDLLVQLQQQSALGPVGPMALNLNLSTNNQHAQSINSNASSLGSPIRSPVSRLGGQDFINAPTTSNTQSPQAPIKKLKIRHNHNSQQPIHQTQQSYQNRSSEATSKPQHSSPKNYSTSISNINSSRSNNFSNQNTSSSSSSAFLANNVGLPRKLVRGQDVWLGRGAEQTRQILKCMWCGQSFRTLAEMTQHMKITQHYTNIISQEQITSWRQPEGSDSGSKHGSNKQNAQIRSIDDNLDDHSSGKFDDDSDRDDSFSNDEDLDQQKQQSVSNQSQNNISHRLEYNMKSEPISDDRESANELSRRHSAETPHKINTKSSAKPLTRSRKREKEILPAMQDANERDRENSPANSNSSQQRQNIDSNLILGDLNEDSESNKHDTKTNGKGLQDTDSTGSKLDETKDDVELDDIKEAANNVDEVTSVKSEDQHNSSGLIPDECESELELETKLKKSLERLEKDIDGDNDGLCLDDSNQRNSAFDAKREISDMKDVKADGIDEEKFHTKGEQKDVDEQASETNESATTTTTASVALTGGQQTDGTGDPLSALETMVEKSFDPRMRPGVANGGILQRLGIDEEVCPPWQQLNYANWYAAAAYHPMAAAALLAAGINLQNGIKLSKNAGAKKNDD